MLLATRHVRSRGTPARSRCSPSRSALRAGVHVFAGELAAAAALVAGGRRGRRAATGSGTSPIRRAVAGGLAWPRGRRHALIEASDRRRDARGEGRCWRVADYAAAVLYNGLGRYDGGAGRRPGGPASTRRSWRSRAGRLPELVEAAARSGAADLAADALAAARGDDPCRRHRLGARRRGALARAAERRRRRRGPLPRGDRAARPHPRPRRARARPPPLRRVAAPRAPAGGRPRAAAHRARDVRGDGRRGLRRARRARAAGHRRDRAQAHRRDARRAHRPGGADRPARPRRPVQPRDRRPAVHQPAHRRVPPAQGLRASSTSARARSSAAHCPGSRAHRGRPRRGPRSIRPPSSCRARSVSASARAPPRRGERCCCRSRSRYPAHRWRPSADRVRRASGCRSRDRTGRRARRPSCRG